MSARRLKPWVPLFLLTALTAVVYGRVVAFGFVDLDDAYHVTENPHVAAGWTLDGVPWAFSTYEGSNWHPLTWLSFMLDAALGGVTPWIFHGTNLLLHGTNTLLLFLVLDRITREKGKSLLVAALFAVHPLHVESVAWISERKGVLSTLFWFLALLAYAHCVERPSLLRWLPVGISMALGLMAKPMLVTLPVTLLLLDLWPLHRQASPGERRMFRLPVPVWEKLPLFLLAAASAAITVFAQRAAGALGDLEIYPLRVRVSNALVSYATYLGKTFWPSGLAVFYPHPGASLPAWKVAGSGTLVLGLTVFSLLVRRKRPYVLAGWLWFVLTLLPVVGLVQVGMQARADRYTYVPLVGIFVAVSWGIPDLLARLGRVLSSTVWVSVSAALVMTLAGVAHAQVGRWRDSATLFHHAIGVTGPNAVARNCLGLALARQGRDEEAREQFAQAVRIRPEFVDARSNLAGVLFRQGRIDEGIEQCREVLRIHPRHVRAHTNLGLVLMQREAYQEAAMHLSASLDVRPNHAGTRARLGAALLRLDRPSEARLELEKALALDPELVAARIDLGVALVREGRLEEASRQFSEAVRRDPGNPIARRYVELLSAGPPGAR